MAYKLLVLLLIALLTSSFSNAAPATLTWTPPTQNDDGTPLTDLASYEIWHGCNQSGSYDTVAVIAAGNSTYIVSGLPDTGTCYFAAKATNSEGRSSVFSNEATKVMGILELPGTVDDTVITWVESAQNLVISNTQPGSYEWDVLSNGDLVYIDRGYVFTSIPNQLLGLDYLRTANNDKANPAGVSFDVNKLVTVFVLYDVRIAVPAWLLSWTNTGLTATSDTPDLFIIYSKDFAAGNVSLGNNEGAGWSMYSVVVK